MIAFVHIQKCAGTSLKFVLRNSFGLRHCDVLPVTEDRTFYDADLRFVKRLYPWLQSIAGHSLIHPTHNISEPLDYYTYLRDPIERCASHYQYHLQVMNREATFVSWIHEPQWQDYQVKKIAGEANVQKAIELLEKHFFFVGLTERFDEGLQILSALAPYRIDPGYTPQNIAAGNHIKDAVLAEHSAWLQEFNQLDQQLYTYVQEQLYPRHKARAEEQVGSLAESLGEPGRPSLASVLGRLYYKGFYRQALKFRT